MPIAQNARSRGDSRHSISLQGWLLAAISRADQSGRLSTVFASRAISLSVFRFRPCAALIETLTATLAIDYAQSASIRKPHSVDLDVGASGRASMGYWA